ncbi:MAG TPA: NAD(P)-binding domain-containing protein [Solirubrobacteraceae bacterium]|nr:NAD(P)-binding domain-containing protein [Solirubrobacteraceae bacterium]
MTTAIIGVGHIGKTLGEHFVAGGERVVLAARDQADAARVASEPGEPASAASVADANRRPERGAQPTPRINPERT